jgi:hypothetical protein
MAYTTIKKPSDYFNTKLYSGNASTQAITGINFQSDMVWTKARSGTYSTQDHAIIDIVRGVTKTIRPNDTTVEGTETNTITSFDTDGYTIGGDNGKFNQSSTEYVSWNWLASNTTASNTQGDITSTVSANTTSGFSIVKYTGDGTNTATIGHGLGVIPSMVIMRPLDYVGAWWITHKNLSTDNVLEFNTNAQVSYSSFGGGGLRQSQYTSSIITGGAGGTNSDLWNQSSQNYIAYCFAEKKGYSKFGSYVGNSNTDGIFVYTGFKPAFVIIKNISISQHWNMNDNKRDPFNVVSKRLYPSSGNEEVTDTAYYMDYLSNGFKMRSTSASWNASGNTYIYMAFAEEPLVGDNPATAR